MAGDDLLHVAFNHAAVGMTLVTLDGHLFKVNCAMCGVVGYADEELLKTTLQAIIHRDDWLDGHMLMQRLLAGELNHYHARVRFVHKLGHTVQTLTSVALVRDAAGKPRYFVVQAQDLHPAPLSPALSKHAQYLQLMQDQSVQFAGLLQADGVLVEINQTALSSGDLLREDVIGQLLWEAPWWAAAPEAQRLIQYAVGEASRGRTAHFEVGLTRANQQVITIDFTLKPVIDVQNQMPLLLLEGRDITMRKRADSALRESEAHFRSAFDHAAIGMALVAPDGRWLKVNAAVCQLSGYSEAELLATDVQSLTHPDDLVADQENIQRVLTGQVQYYHVEKRYIHKRGHIVWTQLSVSLVRDARGYPLHFVSQIQDITASKRTKYELAQRLEELSRSNAELEQFAYVASHDLQEPLRKVAAYAELLQKRHTQQLDPSGHKYVAYIIDGAMRMQSLISDLLAYSRVGRDELSAEPVDLAVVLRQVLTDLAAKIHKYQARITYEPLPIVSAGFQQMSQLLQNLIGNAIKFHSDEPPQVHISARQQGDKWLIGVQDNGIGIEPEYTERIFAIFQRLHSRSHYPGTGIGLAICKKIVERYGGSIWVESQPGQGSTFYFTLPVTS